MAGKTAMNIIRQTAAGLSTQSPIPRISRRNSLKLRFFADNLAFACEKFFDRHWSFLGIWYLAFGHLKLAFGHSKHSKSPAISTISNNFRSRNFLSSLNPVTKHLLRSLKYQLDSHIRATHPFNLSVKATGTMKPN